MKFWAAELRPFMGELEHLYFWSPW